MRIRPISVAVLLLLAGLLAAGKANAQAVQPCTPAAIEAPLELNTVTVGSLVKTIKVEKEIFLCGATPIGPSFIRDVQLFTEVIERLRRKDGNGTFEIVAKSFEVITCEKAVEVAALKDCRASTPPSLSQLPILQGCRFGQQPTHPIAMNTVAVDDFVKTIKAQKELFQCDTAIIVSGAAQQIFGPVIVDLNTLTEIIEQKIETPVGGETFHVVEKRVEEAICVKTFDGVVQGCGSFPVPVLKP